MTNCYDCALRNGGMNYQCNFNNKLNLVTDGGNMVCCDPFSTKSYC